MNIFAVTLRAMQNTGDTEYGNIARMQYAISSESENADEETVSEDDTKKLLIGGRDE